MKASLVVTGIVAGIGIALAGAGSALAATGDNGASDLKLPDLSFAKPGGGEGTDISWTPKGGELQHVSNPFVGNANPLGFLWGDSADGKAEAATVWSLVATDFKWEAKGFDFSDVKEAGFGPDSSFGGFDRALLGQVFDKSDADIDKFFASEGIGQELNTILGIVPAMQAFDAALFSDVFALANGALDPEDFQADLFGSGKGGEVLGLFPGAFDELGDYFKDVFDFSNLGFDLS